MGINENGGPDNELKFLDCSASCQIRKNGTAWSWATRMTTTACNDGKSGSAFSGIVHTYQRWTLELMTVYECIVLGCYEGKIACIHKDFCVLDEVSMVPYSLLLFQHPLLANFASVNGT